MIEKKQFKIFSNNEQLNDAIQNDEISNYLQEIVNKSLEVKYEKEEFKILQKIIQKQDTEINKLNNVIDKIKDITRWLIIIPSRDKEGDYRPIKNTTVQECYKALAEIKEILEERRGEYE